MSFSLTWLPDVLKAAGLKVAICPGWEERGHGDMGAVQGVLCHHTAGPPRGNMPSLDTLIQGRPDLKGPLAHLGLGRDGTFYVVAAGLCYHAGAGRWRGITAGNTHFIGIEAENTGNSSDSPWPQIQVQCYRQGAAAILRRIQGSADFCIGHKEYALPVGRKTDPNFDMQSFRVEVATLLNAGVPALTPIPAMEAAGMQGEAPRRTLRRGERDLLVRDIQAACGVHVDGSFGAETEASVREFQRGHGLTPDGIVGPKTWEAIDRVMEH
ncbi:N-acetylmuramoyl-L-alanine amidase [Trinickia symbiotica]|uniref:N-acetylmuramoyl-L-alanine amidase n=1 Tax=Trinickia symbiotica TaxID=863227 RepID=A0A2T3XYS4_9BURK|nr:peptidoglycan-binding domain-containing protein [Trinickia symbiotica]PTB21642.1 N-acetylmuramoyl-L-alanine amidase [Trinickia symbiotica]